MPVSTILTPGERQRVDAAAEGLYSALHRESFDEVLADLRERRAGAVLDFDCAIWTAEQCANGSNGERIPTSACNGTADGNAVLDAAEPALSWTAGSADSHRCAPAIRLANAA